MRALSRFVHGVAHWVRGIRSKVFRSKPKIDRSLLRGWRQLI